MRQGSEAGTSAERMLQTAFLIPLLPLISFVAITFCGKKLPGKGSSVGIFALGWGLFHSVWIFLTVLSGANPPGQFGQGRYDYNATPYVHHIYDLIKTGDTAVVSVNFRIDGLTAVMLVVVTLVSFLVHVYSRGYMGYGTEHEDKRFSRFYASLSLFSFSMLVLVMTDNFGLLFISWELVGLCSYFLIGHWFEKDYPNPNQITPREAALKAFLTTKIGDLGFIIGLIGLFGLCYTVAGDGTTFNMLDVQNNVAKGLAANTIPMWALTAVGLALFFGAVGKSAQFPLHTWLPDAMEGPTPVSALIHAATMVAAGVYLVGRIFPILTPMAGWIIALVGGFTALFAAGIAFAQFDIKKVLAYSTISQLGYMIMSLGVGAADMTGSSGGYQAGLMHLTTHAMFKACLFLCSGSVIHAVEHALHHIHSHDDPQDMRNMGGLFKSTGEYSFFQTVFLMPFMPLLGKFSDTYKQQWNSAKMPVTFWTMLVATVAISGVPFFSGFLSKDAILGGTAHLFLNAEGGMKILAGMLLICGFGAAFLTAFYMFRLMYMTFFGEPKMPEEAYAVVHESPKSMTYPLAVLAILSFWCVFSFDPTGLGSHGWFYYQSGTSPDGQARTSGVVKEPRRVAFEYLGGEHRTDAGNGSFDILPSAHAEDGAGKASSAGGHHGPNSLAKYGAFALSLIIAFVAIGKSRRWYLLQKGAPEKEFAERRPELYDNLSNKWYFDEFYDSNVVKPTLQAADLMAAFDASVIDSFVNSTAVVMVMLSKIKDSFDNYVIDSIVDSFGHITSFLGGLFRRVQTGLVQSYLVYITLLVAAVAVLFQIAG